jgi:outer membrane murein-binding lipoprotein Lpp
MTTRSRPRRAFCGAAVLAIAAIGSTACGGGSSDVQREQERIDALSARISSLESDLSQLQSEVPAASTSSTSSSGG